MMKRMHKMTALFLAVALLLSFVGCGGENSMSLYGDMDGAPGFEYGVVFDDETNAEGTEADEERDEMDSVDPELPETEKFIENAFISTALSNVSTLSADVDTASYTYFRKLVNQGGLWSYLIREPYSFRTEEFINYFDYTDAARPKDGELFGVATSVFPCPWNEESVLLRATLQAAEAKPVVGNNLVFLIDVSGSMMSADKLPLLKKAFSYLVDQLGESDVISIVTYSGREAVVLRGCEGTRRAEILNAINSLNASGSTNGQAGLQKAYSLAAENFIEGGNNRIIMASDGDLNVGISSAEELKAFVSDQRANGIYLSVLGFGTGNYRDANMEALADNGNGIYYYIDGESEAERVFCTDLLGTLYTVAEDVKLQITFDPEHVDAYRLIGYENRLLSEEDFTDDTKDAGEVGASHTVTVCYELRLKDGAMASGEGWLTLAVNYKHPGEDTSVPPEYYTVGTESYSEVLSQEARFVSCVIEFCMLLHGSENLPEGFTLGEIVRELESMDLSQMPERAEFAALLKKLMNEGGAA